MRRAALALWLLLVAPVEAEVERVWFNTWPGAGVTVAQDGKVLGVSPGPLEVEVDPSDPERALPFTFSRKGYRTKTHHLVVEDLLDDHQTARVELEPESLWVVLGDHPSWWAAPILVLGVGVWLYDLRRETRRRLEALEVSSAALRGDFSGENSVVGRQVAGYLLEERLGEGGMAAVFRARDLAGDSVAVKLIHPREAENPLYAQRFRREADICASLRHPNLVRVLRTPGEHDELLFIVMEVVAGGSLRAVVRNGPAPLRLGLGWMVQVCHGLGAIHQAGVVHRDIKPDNILLTHEGTVKLTDFGLARTDDCAPLTSLDAVVGTPSYMAPEQIRGDAVDARTDLYSLGVTFYEVFTGELPFPKGDVVTLMHQHLEEPPEDPGLFRHDLPGPLRALLLRLLQKTPAARPASAAEVAALVDRILRSL